MLRVNNLRQFLMSRDGRRHEHHRVQGKCLANLVGRDQMPVMYGVEGSPYHAQPHHEPPGAFATTLSSVESDRSYARTWPSPYTMYFNDVNDSNPMGPR